jgi:hypothetical protein
MSSAFHAGYAGSIPVARSSDQRFCGSIRSSEIARDTKEIARDTNLRRDDLAVVLPRGALQVRLHAGQEPLSKKRHTQREILDS